MWTWNVSRSSLAFAAVLAALAFSSSSLLVSRANSEDLELLGVPLDFLTQLFVVLALGALAAGLVSSVVTILWWGYRWWTPVALRDVSHHLTYWTRTNRIELGGVYADFRAHVRDVRQQAEVHIGAGTKVCFTSWSGRTLFPQAQLKAETAPKQGDVVRATLRFKPKWWQGRRVTRVIDLEVHAAG